MGNIVFIIVAFIAVMAMIFFPAQFYIICAIVGGFALLLWLIHDTVKSAVKDALREYEKEKAEANGQK